MSRKRREAVVSRRGEERIARDYRIEFVEYADGGFFARIPDLPHCIAEGRTLPETLQRLENNKKAWIEAQRELGRPVPEPTEIVPEYSGRFLLRVPKSLHGRLAEDAKRDGVSLNQFVVQLLAERLGGREIEATLKATCERLASLLKQISQQSQPSLLHLWPASTPALAGYRLSVGLGVQNPFSTPSQWMPIVTTTTVTSPLFGQKPQGGQSEEWSGMTGTNPPQVLEKTTDPGPWTPGIGRSPSQGTVA